MIATVRHPHRLAHFSTNLLKHFGVEGLVDALPHMPEGNRSLADGTPLRCDFTLVVVPQGGGSSYETRAQRTPQLAMFLGAVCVNTSLKL
jgi:hypothetical protein